MLWPVEARNIFLSKEVPVQPGHVQAVITLLNSHMIGVQQRTRLGNIDVATIGQA